MGACLDTGGLGILNLVFAGLAIAAAASTRPSPEMKLAEEMRKLAAEIIESDLKSGPGLAGSFGLQAAVLLLPAIASIIRASRKRK
jgi:hypothetical protein